MSSDLRGRTIVITGGSRGIGREIALRCAADGANLVVAGKTSEPDPRLPGTIHTVAAEVEAAGGRALPIRVDVRSEEDVRAMVAAAAGRFGGIDALINNAGAIMLASTAGTPMKRFDLMHQVNVRAVFMCTQAALPHLERSPNPHVINLSPPLSTEARWFSPHLAYSLSKYGMTMCTIGMAEEFRRQGIAVNSLWPRRMIATAATRMLLGEEGTQTMRSPRIVADAAYEILRTPSRELTGQTLIDEDFLRTRGVEDFTAYDGAPGVEPPLDVFVD